MAKATKKDRASELRDEITNTKERLSKTMPFHHIDSIMELIYAAVELRELAVREAPEAEVEEEEPKAPVKSKK